MLPVVGLMSTFREGRLALAAVDSLLRCCDTVFALEGPIGDTDPQAGEETMFWRGRKVPPGIVVKHLREPSASDAAKRTMLLDWAKEKTGGPFWGVVLDGDEVLLWPELLPDYLWRAEHADEPGGVALRVCEADGQVYESSARAMRFDRVRRYVLSGYQMELESGVVATFPLVPAKRPPIMGEPHILHRAYLRPPKRNDGARLSAAERDDLVSLGFDPRDVSQTIEDAVKASRSHPVPAGGGFSPDELLGIRG